MSKTVCLYYGGISVLTVSVYLNSGVSNALTMLGIGLVVHSLCTILNPSD